MAQPIMPKMPASAFQRVQDHLSSEGIFLMADAQVMGFPMRYASPGFEQLYGYTAAEIVGKKCGDLLGGPAIVSSMESLAGMATAAICPLQEADTRLRFLIGKAGEACRVMMASPGTRVGVALLVNRKKSGVLFVCECLLLNLRHPALNWSYCVGFQRDISREVPLRTLLANASEEAYARLLQSRSQALECRRTALLGVGNENIMRYLHEKAVDVFSADIWRTLRSELITSAEPNAGDAQPTALAAIPAPAASAQGQRLLLAPAMEASTSSGVSVRRPVSAAKAAPAAQSYAVVPGVQRVASRAVGPNLAPGCSGGLTSGAGVVSSAGSALTKRSLAQDLQQAAPVAGAPCLDLQVTEAAPQPIVPFTRPGSLLADSCQEMLMTSSVVEFLADVGLQKYAETLLVNGFDDMETLIGITDDDMQDLGIPRGHSMKLRRCLRALECLQICAINAGTSARPQLEEQLDAPAPGSPKPSGGDPAPSAEEKTAVQKSWERVEAFGTARFGERLFGEFFERDPKALALFPPEVCEKYWDWSAEATDAIGSRAPVAPQLYAKIVNMIGGAVVGLHDAQSLVPSLVRLGARHCAYGLKKEHFGNFAQALTDTLQECLGEEFTPEVALAWSVVLNFITATMVGGMQAASALAQARGPEQEFEAFRSQPEETAAMRASSGGKAPTLLQRAHAGLNTPAAGKHSGAAKSPF